jgi:hypothetical protein
MFDSVRHGSKYRLVDSLNLFKAIFFGEEIAYTAKVYSMTKLEMATAAAAFFSELQTQWYYKFPPTPFGPTTIRPPKTTSRPLSFRATSDPSSSVAPVMARAACP